MKQIGQVNPYYQTKMTTTKLTSQLTSTILYESFSCCNNNALRSSSRARIKGTLESVQGRILTRTHLFPVFLKKWISVHVERESKKMSNADTILEGGPNAGQNISDHGSGPNNDRTPSTARNGNTRREL